MKRKICLTVNGHEVDAEVEPRLQLADFLRDHLLLTGTHLGCEHGVCGACTIEVDGAPARSCITYAVACSGSEVRTIEGFESDALMAQLREAFSAHHALQCGYCTPGMLVTARDIVLRLPQADERRIRKELAGNLCRCTGYVGIVRAIESVLAARRGSTAVAATKDKQGVSPGGAPLHAGAAALLERRASAVTAGHELEPPRQKSAPVQRSSSDRSPAAGRLLHQSFVVDHPRPQVWAYFGRLEEVTSCLPGASVTATPADDRVETVLRVKVGPISTEFKGIAEVERLPESCSGVIHGSARDARSSSATRGDISYVLHEEKGGSATRVDLSIDYTLTGTLAQFGRSGIVEDIASRMTAAFARNLEARLNALSGRGSNAEAERGIVELNAGSLFLRAVWSRIKRYWASLLRRDG